jgi:hypothetical protein
VPTGATAACSVDHDELSGIPAAVHHMRKNDGAKFPYILEGAGRRYHELCAFIVTSAEARKRHTGLRSRGVQDSPIRVWQVLETRDLIQELA